MDSSIESSSNGLTSKPVGTDGKIAPASPNRVVHDDNRILAQVLLVRYLSFDQSLGNLRSKQVGLVPTNTVVVNIDLAEHSHHFNLVLVRGHVSGQAGGVVSGLGLKDGQALGGGGVDGVALSIFEGRGINHIPILIEDGILDWVSVCISIEVVVFFVSAAVGGSMGGINGEGEGMSDIENAICIEAKEGACDLGWEGVCTVLDNL